MRFSALRRYLPTAFTSVSQPAVPTTVRPGVSASDRVESAACEDINRRWRSPEGVLVRGLQRPLDEGKLRRPMLSFEWTSRNSAASLMTSGGGFQSIFRPVFWVFGHDVAVSRIAARDIDLYPRSNKIYWPGAPSVMDARRALVRDITARGGDIHTRPGSWWQVTSGCDVNELRTRHRLRDIVAIGLNRTSWFTSDPIELVRILNVEIHRELQGGEYPSDVRLLGEALLLRKHMEKRTGRLLPFVGRRADGSFFDMVVPDAVNEWAERNYPEYRWRYGRTIEIRQALKMLSACGLFVFVGKKIHDRLETDLAPAQ